MNIYLLYEYHCYTCDADFERRNKMNDRDTNKKCPLCGQDNTSRKMATPYVRYVGSGWANKDLKK